MNKLITNVSVAGVFSSPNFQSEMITQSLIWEELEIIEQNRQWFKVKLFDDYEGWIHQFYIVKKHSKNNNSATYIETKPFGQIYHEPNSNSAPILNCPFGVKLPAIDTKIIEEMWWHHIQLPDLKMGWIQDSGYKKSSSIRKTIKTSAQKLLGISYVWGGRSSFGFDCSGFVQTIFKFCGYILPRDSIDQLNFDKMDSINNKISKVGDLVFFSIKNKIIHVGISLGDETFIHSSGDVKQNSLNPSDENFDENLASMYHSTLSIKQLIQE